MRIWKRILLLLCFSILNCSPEPAKVVQDPLPPSEAEAFSALSLKDARLQNQDWFLWGEDEHRPQAIQLMAMKKEVLKLLADLTYNMGKVKLLIRSFMTEHMGADNYAIYQSYEDERDLVQQHIEAINKWIADEMQKPEDQRDHYRIQKMKFKLKLKTKKHKKIKQRLAQLRDTYLPDEESKEKLKQMLGQKDLLEKNHHALMQKAKQVTSQLATLVEVHKSPPTLLLQQGENGLIVSLQGFAMSEEIPCSTKAGNVFDLEVLHNKGLLNFSVYCQQRSAEINDVYIFQLEQIQKDPMVLHGNFARCSDKKPSMGKCQAGLRYGQVRFAAHE